jgi:hypothetical protein
VKSLPSIRVIVTPGYPDAGRPFAKIVITNPALPSLNPSHLGRRGHEIFAAYLFEQAVCRAEAGASFIAGEQEQLHLHPF